MDAHLKKLGPCTLRVLDAVWFVKYSGTQKELIGYMASIAAEHDRFLASTASNAAWSSLLVSNDSLLDCWEPPAKPSLPLLTASELK